MNDEHKADSRWQEARNEFIREQASDENASAEFVRCLIAAMSMFFIEREYETGESHQSALDSLRAFREADRSLDSWVQRKFGSDERKEPDVVPAET